jgi:hypothetical protein
MFSKPTPFKGKKSKLSISSVSENIQPKICTASDQYALNFGCPLKGTVSSDYKCLEVISIKSPLLGHVTLDTKKI